MGTSVPHHTVYLHSSAPAPSPLPPFLLFTLWLHLCLHGNHWTAQSILRAFSQMMGLKIISVCVVFWQQTAQRTVWAHRGELSLSVLSWWSGQEERVWNDSVMNLPSDSCWLAGGLARALSLMDSTRTEEAFALWQLKDGWWWMEITPNAVDYIRSYKHSWAGSKLLVGLNDFPLNRFSYHAHHQC